MGFLETVLAQLAEPFRIGLLIALVVTAANTGAATGTAIPLLLGAVFVAVLIPSTLGSADADRTTATLAGLVSNAVLLAVIYGLKLLYLRLSNNKP